MTCTFSNGARVSFNVPLPDLQGEEQSAVAEVTFYDASGSTCGTINAQTSNGVMYIGISCQSGVCDTAINADSNADTYSLACPSRTYSASSSAIDMCTPATIFPEFTVAQAGATYSLTISSASTLSPLFTCQ